MPRVILVEQPAYEHTYTMMVRVTDINHSGHLGNEALLGLVHEARTHFLKALNFDTIVGSQQPVGLIIADLAVNFKAEGFAHEEVSMDSQIDELGQKSFRLFHRIRRREQVIALVETGLVAYSYSARQVTELPVEFLSALKEYRVKLNNKKKERRIPHELSQNRFNDLWRRATARVEQPVSWADRTPARAIY